MLTDFAMEIPSFARHGNSLPFAVLPPTID
jgi:hypothetical protein